jgi:excisionase family DNA binding protein
VVPSSTLAAAAALAGSSTCQPSVLPTPARRPASPPADQVVGGLGGERGRQVAVMPEGLLGDAEQLVGGGQLVGGPAGVRVGQDVGGDLVAETGERGRQVAVHVVPIELAEVPVQVDIAHHRVAQVAELLKVSAGTVRRWRREGIGPPVLWAGDRPRYRRADVDAWLQRENEGEPE